MTAQEASGPLSFHVKVLYVIQSITILLVLFLLADHVTKDFTCSQNSQEIEDRKSIVKRSVQNQENQVDNFNPPVSLKTLEPPPHFDHRNRYGSNRELRENRQIRQNREIRGRRWQPESAGAATQKKHKKRRKWDANDLRLQKLSSPQSSRIVRMPIFFNIDESALVNYCVSMVNFCARLPEDDFKTPGPAGPPGPPGEKGEKGEDGTCANVTCNVSSSSNEKYRYETDNPSKVEMGPLPDTKIVASSPAVSARLTTTQGEAGGLLTRHVGQLEDPHSSEEPDTEVSKSRKKRCFIEIVDQPAKVIANTGVQFGCWMRDRMKSSRIEDSPHWLTTRFQNQVLQEYKDDAALHSAETLQVYMLKYPYEGTNHLVYSRNFYYFSNHGGIVKFDLNTQEYLVEKADFVGSGYLYPLTKSKVEISGDKHGVWIIFPSKRRPGFIEVRLVNPQTLARKRSWILPLATVGTFENTFITCGTIFGLKSSSSQNATRISYAYDLHCRRPVTDVAYLSWKQSMESASSVQYDDVTKRLFVYDRGVLKELRVPVKCKPCAGRKRCGMKKML